MMSLVSTGLRFYGLSSRLLTSIGKVSNSNLMLARACFNASVFEISILGWKAI